MEFNEIINQAVGKLAELNLSGPLHRRDDIYHKPSNHLQSCYICDGEIEKDDLIRREQQGSTRAGYPRYIYTHLDCFLAVVFHTILKMKEKDGITKNT